MEKNKVYRAIGLMSGTSLDGEIDVALIETDGQGHVKVLDFYAHRYDQALCEPIRRVFGQSERNSQVKKAEEKVTDLHIQAIKKSGFEADIIGFHGQTIYHNPAAGITRRYENRPGRNQKSSRELTICLNTARAP